MKLHEKIPKFVIVNGKKVRLNLDFRNVLKMMDILASDDLMPESREWLAMKCICRKPKKGMKPIVLDLLFPNANSNHERITDFAQDADLIRSAFLQVYGIDLFRQKLNWFEFMCYLSCIPEGNRYADILNIRTKPMPEATAYNAKERQRLAQAKSEFGLHVSEKEQQNKYKKDVEALGAFLMAFAGEDNKHG